MKTRLKIAFAGVAAFATWQSLAAQAASAPASNPPPQEEIVELTPFEVTAETDTGYVATETLAGTRIRTELRDVGGAISVITKEFLADIGATDSSTLLQYTTNAEVGGTRGTYAGLGDGDPNEIGNLRAPAGANRLRGLAAADNARDFFVTDIPWDSYNVDRIDIQRGPNSILFGLGSPAGIVNAQMKNAEFRTRGEVQARVGSYSSMRGTLDLNHELIDNVLAFRVTGLWDEEKFQQSFAFENDKRIHGALRFDPQLFARRDFHTSLRVKYEHGDISANRPRTTPPNDRISPFFRPYLARGATPTADNPFGGMNRTGVNNVYDPWRTDGIFAADGTTVVNPQRGQTINTTVNFQAWVENLPNAHQPYWLIDGSTNQLYAARGGYINTGARNNNGSLRTSAEGVIGRRTNHNFMGLRGLRAAANELQLPNAQFGVYREQSLMDDSIFDFYDELIDGPNKSESEKWDAYNIDLTQTAFNDRLGLNLIYDRQKFKRSGSALFNGTPSITLDVLQHFEDYYLRVTDNNPNAGPIPGVSNPNYGRPFVTAGSGGGGGNSYESDREYKRASVFGEVRATDFVKADSFLGKLLGRHRFNGVYADESLSTETRDWRNFTTPRDWDAFWNNNDGNNSSFTDRPPLPIIYLGSSVASRTTAAGADIPGVQARITVPDANVYHFAPTWQNFSVPFGDPWTVPTTLQRVYGGTVQPDGTVRLTQASNPANYIGWTNYPMEVVRFNDGENNLYTRAALSKRETESYAVSWQGYLWNNAIIPTIGWRQDEVKGKGFQAQAVASNRSFLNLQPDVYRLPDAYPANQIFKDESTSYGGVVHLNRLFGDRDPLPLNVSLSYSESANFQVTDTRRDVYGNPIGNPTGNTKDYGVVLSTKDGKYSFRAIKYNTKTFLGNSGINNPGGLGAAVRQGLKWRNVFLYDLGVYAWGDREQPAGRNSWGTDTDRAGNTIGADRSLTFEQGRALEDEAIRVWNEIQAFVQPKGFLQAWSFDSPALDKLTDRSTYEATLPKGPDGKPVPLAVPSAQYMPDPNSLANYSSSPPQNLTVTGDLESKGYEFELTANPLPNWRIAFNASQTEATRKNVGGPAIVELVEFLDSKLIGPDGQPTVAGRMPQFGGLGNSIYNTDYGPWRANYVAMKLQEGSKAPEIREWRYNVVTNYTFREGRLKGLGVGGSYRWIDDVVIGYPVVNGNFDLSKPYRGPAEDAIDLWASYERKISDRINWKIQLNIRNAFDDEGLIPTSVQPDGQTWATVRVKPVQEWFVTNTFSF